jgi:hypothetical protein
MRFEVGVERITHDEKPVDKFSSGASLYVEIAFSGFWQRNQEMMLKWAEMRNVAD